MNTERVYEHVVEGDPNVADAEHGRTRARHLADGRRRGADLDAADLTVPEGVVVDETDLETLGAADDVGERSANRGLDLAREGGDLDVQRVGEAPYPDTGGRSVGEGELVEDRKHAGEMGIAGEPLRDASRPRRRPRRSHVAGFQNHVLDADRLALPGAREPEREAIPRPVVSKIAHGEEVVVRDHAHRRRGAATVAGDEREDFPMPPVAPPRRRLGNERDAEPRQGEPPWHGQNRGAHLEHADCGEDTAADHPTVASQEAEPHPGQDRGDRQERERVAQVLVLEE